MLVPLTFSREYGWRLSFYLHPACRVDEVTTRDGFISVNLAVSDRNLFARLSLENCAEFLAAFRSPGDLPGTQLKGINVRIRQRPDNALVIRENDIDYCWVLSDTELVILTEAIAGAMSYLAFGVPTVGVQ